MGGCQCAKGNLLTDKNNELTKDPQCNSLRNPTDPNKIYNSNNSPKDTNVNVFESLKKDEVQLDDNISNSNNKASIKVNYNEAIFELFNLIRTNPSEYAQTIEDSMANIQMSNDKLIYKSTVKVTLAKGRSAFEEVALLLREMKPMNSLVFKEELVIPLPETKEQLKDIAFFKQQAQKAKSNYNHDISFRDLVKEPETSALLMIVDDIEKNPGKKRSSILNPDYKYVGISSTIIGHSFVAYFAFSKV